MTKNWGGKKLAIMVALATLLLGACAGSSVDLNDYDGYKAVNGVDHYFRSVGRGEPIILVHGGPGMYHDELFPFFLKLAETNQVIFYDQRGNGKSVLKEINEETFNTDILVDDLEGLRQAFGFEKLTIIGHSWGGLVSMHYAATYPEHVKRLITVSSAPINTPLLIASYEKHVSRFAPEEWQYLEGLWASEAFAAGDPEVFNEAMRLSEGRTFYDQSFVDEYMEAAAFTEQTAKNLVALGNLPSKMKFSITLQESINQITAPTLLIQGRHDFTVEEAPRLAQSLIANSELAWIDQAGHYPHVEKKEEFYQILEGFLKRTP